MDLKAGRDRSLTNPGQNCPARWRILLVEDHPIVRHALADLINHEPDLEVCGLADDYASAIRQAELLNPDLILLDISLHGRGGLELLKDLKNRRSGQLVLILSMHEETLYAPRAIRAGASGYIMKQAATENVVSGIRKVLSGEIYLSPGVERSLMQRLVGGGIHQKLDPLEALTDREFEIFRLIGQGRSSRDIAQLLCLSVKTIESHRAHVKDKLNIKSASELVQQAIQLEREGMAPGRE